ncbi:MAG: hypothetical protein EAZ89_05185 [Bacteroidetes bacterium]|nr:MAG: hypothetical protein EAZ89_05185 [Bacteroidota bacterium]
MWNLTLGAMVLLYILCNVLPDSLVGKILPLHNVFKPHTNIDLDFQSIGYALLHTTWATRITHSTILIEAVSWFVVFQSWHWSIPAIALGVMLIQSLLIGDLRFGICFMLVGAAVWAAAYYITGSLGMAQVLLLAKVILMLGGLMRMLSHSAELIPPILLNNSDQFVKLSAKNVNWKIPLSSLIGYVAEFGSGLPNRILPVQVNYVYQTLFRVQPVKTLSWQEVESSAKTALTGGYSALHSLRSYYRSVMRK